MFLFHEKICSSFGVILNSRGQKGRDGGDFRSDFCFVWLKSFLNLPNPLVVQTKYFSQTTVYFKSGVIILHACRHILKDAYYYVGDGYALCLDPAQEGFGLTSLTEN